MQIINKTALLLLLCALLICGCTAAPLKDKQPLQSTNPLQSSPNAPAQGTAPTQNAPTPPDEPQGKNYPQQVADEVLAKLLPQGKNSEDKAVKILAAYEYIIANTYFAPPIGVDIWQVRGGSTPTYVEARALSPLLFGIGSCEDYAAALTLLLQRMGFAAEYIPGLTISVNGGFVDHAWVMVELDGFWYHLDPQLEQNVMKNNTITYRYFLKHDQAMLADHRWGENLLNYGVLSSEQSAELSDHYLGHSCTREYPHNRAPKRLALPLPPNRSQLEQNISDEIKQYEKANGALPPNTLDITPPIFGYEGYRENDKARQ